MNLRERLEREERRRQVASNVALYQALAICALTCAVAFIAAVVAVVGV